MKIAIDISQVVYGTGVSVYTKELVTNLLQTDKDNEYVLFAGTFRRREEFNKYKAKIFPVSPTIANLVWNKLHILPIEKLIGKVDVFHSSDWTQPPSKAFKVTTVHDLAPILFPQFTHPRIVAAHKRRLEWVKKEVDRIIVPSEIVKKDLIKLGFSENNIRVIPEAAGPEFKKVNSKPTDIQEKYILTIGAGGRKNTDNLIAAAKKVGIKLVIVGRPYMDFISDEELIKLYSHAEAMVYPSIYEGFGLPVLQAMACECPVVTSQNTAMAEIAKNVGILIDPNSVDSIAEGIKKALKNRESLITKGLQRSKEYSWQKTANETLEVYKESL